VRAASISLLTLVACGRVGFDSRGAGDAVVAGDASGAYDAQGADAPAALCAGLVSHLKLDESGGTTALDSVSQVNAPLVGGVSFSSSGVLGGAASFSASGLVNLMYSDRIPVADFTLAAWIRPADLSNRTLFSAKNTNDTVQTQLKWTNPGDLELRINNVLVFNDLPGFAADSTWQHVVLTRTGNALAVYRNGAALQTATDGNPIDFAPGTCGVGIGSGASTCSAPPGYQFWDGMIDDVRVYDRGLPSAEVELLHTASLAGTVPACSPP
jgi:hypothetical protein